MPAVRRLLRLGLGKKFKVVRRARTVHVVCPNWCTVPLCPTRLPAASKMHRARATSKWGARAALVATLALVSATPSAPHFTVRFRPEAGSAVLLPDGTTVALAGAPAAVATIASKGTYTGTIVLSPEDALFLSIRSAAALPGTPTCPAPTSRCPSPGRGPPSSPRWCTAARSAAAQPATGTCAAGASGAPPSCCHPSRLHRTLAGASSWAPPLRNKFPWRRTSLCGRWWAGLPARRTK